MQESSMTHAMVISGVHLDPSGKPVRYKVENSWGDRDGDKGYFVMTDAWFEQYVFPYLFSVFFHLIFLIGLYIKSLYRKH